METGHIKRDCPKRSPIRCFQCGEVGHLKKDCSKSPPAKTTRSSPSAHSDATSSSVEFIDSHCHIEYIFERFKHRGTFEAFCSKHGPYPHNFAGCITVFCDPASFSSFGIWPDLLKENKVFGAFGIHPHNAKYYTDAMEEKIVEALAHPKAVAWGEMGLDYAKHSPDEYALQKNVFERQLRRGVSLGKPLVIHCRDAEDDVIECMGQIVPREWKIHLHCYTGSMGNLQKFFDAFPCLCVGFTGVVTFASAQQVQQCAQETPLDRLLLETDAPYMVPRAVRQGNKFSHPSMIPQVAHKIAQLKKMTLDDILTAARKNTEKIYGV